MSSTNKQTSENCRLCGGEAGLFHENQKQIFYKCTTCSGIFLAKHLLPENDFEFSRYKLHQNDIEDPGYQKFTAPIADAILKNYSPGHTLLDFGAGARSVIAKQLSEKGIFMSEYDPFFQDNGSLLEKKYDHIACCETIEHFHYPKKEFELLRSLLKPGGNLYLMTDPYREGMDFANWYYKNDPTHVFFYSKDTFEWIKEKYGFSTFTMNGRLIVLASA